MVTETRAPDSQDSPPSLPEAVPDASIEEPGAAQVKEPTPVTGEALPEEPTPTPEPPQALTLPELEAKAKREGLTPGEWEQIDTLRTRRDQSEADRQRQTQDMETRERARLQELGQAQADLRTELKANRERELQRATDTGRDPDLELIAERDEQTLAKFLTKTEEIHLGPIAYGLRSTLLQVVGDTPQNRRALNAFSLPDLVTEMVSRAHDAGRVAGPDDKHVVMTKEDLEQAKQKAVDDWSAKHPERVPSTRQATGVAHGQVLTLDQIEAMPTNEWLSKPREERNRLLSQARENAAKGR